LATASTVALTRSSPGQEPHDRQQQQGRVEFLVVVMLPEHATAGNALVQHLGLDLVGSGLPAPGAFVVPPLAGEIGAPGGRHPAHHLRGGEVPRVAADLPDALIGLAPAVQGGFHEAGQALPHRRHDLAGFPAELDVQGVQDHAPHVVLALVPGPVADPDRARPAVPGQVVEGPLGQVPFAADAVHDLQLGRPAEVTAGDGVEDEGEILDRLPVEAQPVQRAEHER
jgi:hypothetical protein